MKIKNNHHHSIASSNQANETYSNSTQQSSSSNNNSSQIWTRSAVRAAQQQQQRLNETCARHKHHGHALGKIVKPIPVRPMSSSSSSSSTHSSHFNHVKSIHSNLSSFGAHLRNDSEPDSALATSNQSFSLIAKYFASFPPSRLAKTQIFSESSNSIVDKSTPFLPFKKPSSNSSGPEQVHSTFVLRSQTGNLTNTDHLCTNFRRMIKLNETAEFRTSPFNNNHNSSPSTHASNTPTGSDPSYAHLTGQSFNLNMGYTSNEDLQHCQSTSDVAYFNENDQVYPLGSNEDDQTTTRLGQITMETRSTRKFLIKHHPYLQQNNSTNYTNKSQQRPSINLMKKLNSKKPDGEAGNSHLTDSCSNNRSGRSSRSNNSNEHITDHNLLKFTDTAPIFSSTNLRNTPTIKQTTGNPQGRRQLKNLTTASALSTELNLNKKHSRSRDKQQVTTACESKNDTSYICDICCCGNDELHENSCDNSYDQQSYDEQGEDSSGYYSSYHSVDLISSSGGSCIGGSQFVNRQSKKNDCQQVKHPDNINQATSINQDHSNKRDNPNNTSTQAPQHHYHTRSLTHCLEQRQDTAATSNSSTNSKGIILPQSVSNMPALITSTSTIPTTRLRYQQQLAAQAGSAAGNLECDLDLDQIEND